MRHHRPHIRVSWLAVAAVAALLAAGCGSSGNSASPPSTTTHPVSTTAPTTVSTTSAPASSTTAPAQSVSVPLYPFADLQEVASWQQGYRAGEGDPTRLDASKTALAFAHFLGYTEVDRVIASREDATGVHVSIGYQVPESANLATAAVIHLVHYGTGTDVPWEVVGSDDTDFSLLTPAYGTRISSPVEVGGFISGVDESIKVTVTQLHSNGSLGQFCCVPGGGTHQPWTASVTFAHPTDHVLIISASTGGHVKTVERFTVTGVEVGG